jgi:hypothetical protein
MSVSARVSFGDATGRESTADLALVRFEQLVATRRPGPVRHAAARRPPDRRQTPPARARRPWPGPPRQATARTP